MMAAMVCSGLLSAVCWQFLRWHGYLGWLAGSGVVTGLLYGWDKLAATRTWRRIPERSLWAMILAGGVFGAWIGQFLFRHKSRKWAFWLVLVLATLLHGVLIWFLWQHTGF